MPARRQPGPARTDPPTVAVVPAREGRPRLVALAAALGQAGFTADVEQNGSDLFVRVINPGAPTCRDRVTVRHNFSDSSALWFYTSWTDPICPVRDIRTAVAKILAALQPLPGARHDR
jgi:hypothetical protein